MTAILSFLGTILFRATWLMLGALLLTALLQRRRPLAASNLLTAVLAGLLALPLLAALLPSLPIPLGPELDDRDAIQTSTAASLPDLVREGRPVKSDADQALNGNTALERESVALIPENRHAGGDSQLTMAEHNRSAATELEQGGGNPTREFRESTSQFPTGSFSWTLPLVALYFLGVVFLTARLGVGLWSIQHLRRTATAVNGDWSERLAGWVRRVGTTRSVELLASDAIAIPMTVGWRKPVILFPSSMLTALSPHQDAVLVHELAHIRRQDYRDLLMLQLVQVLYWCHPLAWIIGPVSRHLRERACDDVCIHWMGARELYRNALLAIAGQTICRPRVSLGLAMTHTSRLSRRVAHIEQSAGSDRCVPGNALRLTVLCSVMALAALAALVQIVPRNALAKPDREIHSAIARETGSLAKDPDLLPSREQENKSADDDRLPALQAGGQAPVVVAANFDPGSLKQWSYAGDQPSAKELLEAIDRAKQFLIKSQQPDGTWNGGGSGDTHTVGVTSLTLLALLKTGMSAADPEIQRGLGWLRKQQPKSTYEISLMIQALAAANDERRDLPFVTMLATELEEMQISQGPDSGSWRYNKGALSGDRSNCQFALLGLREAQEMGVPVSVDTWRKARAHWVGSQKPNGAWGYSGGLQPAPGTGSMTVGGIASLTIIRDSLQARETKLNADGTTATHGDAEIDRALDQAHRWLGKNFAVTNNPGGGSWVLYYLWGLARAGRFGGERFFVNDRGQRHDWYREGAEYLIEVQNRFTGTWKEGDQNALVGTSFALLFLTKGLAPVAITKLKYGPRDAGKNVVGTDWNRHPDDLGHLTKYLSSRPKWPRQLAWQTLDVTQATLADLQQAPILFVSGSEAPQFTLEELVLLKNYIAQGGSLFVDNCARSEPFDRGFRDLVARMYPPAEVQLQRLLADHPVFHSEFNLIDEQTKAPVTELWGVQVDRRTVIVYSPHGLSPLWAKSTAIEIPERPHELASPIDKGSRAGVNVVTWLIKQAVFDQLDRRK